jgi:hypothetical protein
MYLFGKILFSKSDSRIVFSAIVNPKQRFLLRSDSLYIFTHMLHTAFPPPILYSLGQHLLGSRFYFWFESSLCKSAKFQISTSSRSDLSFLDRHVYVHIYVERQRQSEASKKSKRESRTWKQKWFAFSIMTAVCQQLWSTCLECECDCTLL